MGRGVKSFCIVHHQSLACCQKNQFIIMMMYFYNVGQILGISNFYRQRPGNKGSSRGDIDFFLTDAALSVVDSISPGASDPGNDFTRPSKRMYLSTPFSGTQRHLVFSPHLAIV
jgi:hypothetical protein